MTEEDKQDTQKTVVAFIAGLLIGGLLVWVFGGNSQMVEEPNDDNDDDSAVIDTSKEKETNTSPADSSDDAEVVSVPVLPTGDGAVTIVDQEAGDVVLIEGATFPTDEGWIGVRDYENGQMTGLLGVARFSKEQGLIPTEVELLRSTQAGGEYAIVFYTESGDREFNLAEDTQLEGMVDTFTAK